MTRRGFFWLKVCMTLLLIGGMFYFVRVDAIVSAFQQVRWKMVLLGVLLMPLNIGIQSMKWRYLARLVQPETTTVQAVGSLLGGYSFGIVTPGRIGEYSRVMFIPNTPPLSLIGLTVVDKFYNLGVTVAVGLPALMTLPRVGDMIHQIFTLPVAIGLIMINIVLLWFALDPRPVRSLLYALQIRFPKKNAIRQIAGGLDRFTPPEARVVLLLTLAYYVVYILQFYVLLNGFTSLPFLETGQVASAVLFTKSALPITVGGLGMDQLVSVYYSGQYAVPATAAFNASMLLFAINVVIPALAGLFFIARLQPSKNEGDK